MTRRELDNLLISRLEQFSDRKEELHVGLSGIFGEGSDESLRISLRKSPGGRKLTQDIAPTACPSSKVSALCLISYNFTPWMS